MYEVARGCDWDILSSQPNTAGDCPPESAGPIFQALRRRRRLAIHIWTARGLSLHMSASPLAEPSSYCASARRKPCATHFCTRTHSRVRRGSWMSETMNLSRGSLQIRRVACARRMQWFGKLDVVCGWPRLRGGTAGVSRVLRIGSLSPGQYTPVRLRRHGDALARSYSDTRV